ncbi:MAG: fused MFS/spermidine synthase [Myxococcota bacterium]|nr:fused MFS/spermidine synthase [Myxococcota bacterium]
MNTELLPRLHWLSSRHTHGILLALVFLTSCSGLIFELVWMRILSIVFGRTILAVSAVVTVYMLGLGLGSLYFGKRVDASKDSMRLFALLQLGVGLFGLIVMTSFLGLADIYTGIHHLLGASQHTTTLLIYGFSFVLMIPPTFFMGGALPAVAKYMVNNHQGIGACVGKIYAISTAGGIVGAGLAGYLLIGWLGQVESQILAASLCLMAGGTAMLLPRGKDGILLRDEVTMDNGKQHSLRIVYLCLGVAFATGLCGLAYEILCTRALSIFVVNSTYSFTSILIVFLLGISVGSYIFSRFLSHVPCQMTILAISESSIGIYLIAIAANINDLPALLIPLEDTVRRVLILKVLLPSLTLSAALLFVPALLLGIIFPAVCRMVAVSSGRIGRSVGEVYFFNTIGAVLGSLCTGGILIPLIGVVTGIVVIAAVCLCLGMVLLISERELNLKRAGVFALIIVFIGSFFVLKSVIAHPVIHPPSIFRTAIYDDKILHYDESSECTVLVREDQKTGQKTLYVNNNRVMGVTYDAMSVVKMLGHLPFFVNPDAKDVLVVGFGIGITASEVSKHDVQSIDCVEICPGVRQAARFFSNLNRDIINNPKLTYIDGDGRNHLLMTDKKYDIISSDPTHPTLGCANLYTEEYFELCKAHLNENGVVVQYLPLHRLSKDAFKSSIRTFQAVFPHTTVWLGHSHTVLLGTANKTSIDFEQLHKTVQKMSDSMLNDPYQIAAAVLLSEEATARLTISADIHRDNRPFLEFYSPKGIRQENWQENLLELLRFKTIPNEVIRNVEDNEKLLRYMAGRDHFMDALISKSEGNLKMAAENYHKALRAIPENENLKKFLAYESWLKKRRAKKQ